MRFIEKTLEKAGFNPIAGVDEAGRGACAGPLLITAVILKNGIPGLKDSKELSERERERLFPIIKANALAVSIIEVSPREIDKVGVHVANLEGMRRAVLALAVKPEYVLTDGYAIEGLAIPNLAVWKGDQVSPSISAASIIAKVTRDRIMLELGEKYPGYGLEKHKGYVNSSHTKALKELGVTEIHRRSYKNIQALVD